MLIIGGCIGYAAASYQITGYWPGESPEVILPPAGVSGENQSLADVQAFMNNDSTDEITLGEGFNCVEFTFMTMRNANWHGIVAYPIEIDFDDSPNHMVIGFPTNDSGDVFFEPQNDMRIYPAVGRLYMGHRITAIYAWSLSIVFQPLDGSPEKTLTDQ
jgi:hypothetical protein